jgi:hypothetical protein
LRAETEGANVNGGVGVVGVMFDDCFMWC